VPGIEPGTSGSVTRNSDHLCKTFFTKVKQNIPIMMMMIIIIIIIIGLIVINL
jgi:hypothetical protein